MAVFGGQHASFYVQHTDDDGVRKSSGGVRTYRLENKNKRRGRVLAKLTIFLPLPKFQAFTKNKIYSYRWGRTVPVHVGIPKKDLKISSYVLTCMSI